MEESTDLSITLDDNSLNESAIRSPLKVLLIFILSLIYISLMDIINEVI